MSISVTGEPELSYFVDKKQYFRGQLKGDSLTFVFTDFHQPSTLLKKLNVLCPYHSLLVYVLHNTIYTLFQFKCQVAD